jgi:hypothetical protein
MQLPMYLRLWYKAQGQELFINFFIKLNTPLTAQLFHTIGLLKFNIINQPFNCTPSTTHFTYKPGCFLVSQAEQQYLPAFFSK